MIGGKKVRRLLPIALALLVIMLVQFVLVGAVAAESDVYVEKWTYWGGVGPSGGGFASGMTLDGPYAIAGEELFYSIYYYNSGPSTAISVTLTDTLPMEVQYLEDNAGGVPGPGNTLVWDMGDLAPGEYGYIDIKTRVWPDAVADEDDGTILITNTIQATCTEEIWVDDNFDYADTFVQDLADLSVVKMSKPDTVVQAGERFTYTIFVDNWGPSFARNVTIYDKILASGIFTVETVIQDPRALEWGWAVQGIDGEATVVINYPEPLGVMEAGFEEPAFWRWETKVVVVANETQDINNLVEVFSDTPDPDISNNSAIDFISILDTSDLELTKEAYDEPFDPWEGMGDLATAGLGIRYELQVTNHGPSTAVNVVIEDNLPAEVEIFDVYSSQGSCIAGTPGDPSDPTTCFVGTLAPGESATMTIETRLKEDAGGWLWWWFEEEECPLIFNDARTYSDNFDPYNGNNLASVATEACAFSFVYIEKEDDPDPVVAGEVVNYTIYVENEGPSTATDMIVADFLDEGDYLEFLGYTIVGGDGTCEFDYLPYPYNGEELYPCVVCELGDMSAWDGRLINLQFRVKPDTPHETLLYDEVLAMWGEWFFEMEPPWDAEETLVTTEADVEVFKTVSDPTPIAGQQVTFHVTAFNNGPSVARGVEITDTLPVSVTYVHDTLGCGPGLECDLGDLGPGDSVGFDIVAQVDPNAGCGDSLVNEVVISSTETYDPNELNNIGRAGIAVECEADLKIRKFGKPDGWVWAGEELVYTIVVNNLGPGTARNVVMNDRLTSNGTFDLVSVSSDRPGAVISPTSGTFDSSMLLRAELPELEVMTPEQSGEWVITVEVVANEAQSINNIAWVLSDAYDPDVSNNEAYAEHDIHEVSDLGVTKTAWGEVQVDGEPGGTVSLMADEVTAGRGMTYTIVATNHGPSTAYNVEVLDTLPPMLEMTGSDPYGYPIPEGKVKWPLGNIAPGSSVTITVNGFVPSDVVSGTVLANSVMVHSDVIDRNNANDFGNNETVVDNWADLSISKTQAEPALPGEMINYTLVVSNVGPSDATKAMLWDDFPAEIHGATWTAMCEGGALFRDQCEEPEGGCTASGEGDLAELVDLPVGARITVDVGATLFCGCEVVTNTATIIAPIDAPIYQPMQIRDPYAENSEVDVTNEVECQYWPLVLKDIIPGEE